MIVLDVETTGLNPGKHSIVSIGAVNYENLKNIKIFYSECRMRGGAKIDPIALEINGFSEHDVREGNPNSFEKTIIDFYEWTRQFKERTLAGHNIGPFDYLFLKDSFERVGIAWPFGKRTIDLHTTCCNHHWSRRLKIPLKEEGTSILSLDKILEYVGLPLEPKPHTAINGAKLEAEAFYRMRYGKSLFSEFKKFPLPEYLVEK